MNLIRTFETLSSMADVRRYSMIRLSCPENVMEHTSFVALLCLFIGVELNNRGPETVTLSALLAKALLHDIDETITGDIPRPTKYYSKETREMFREIEERGLVRVLDGIDIGVAAHLAIKYWHRDAKSGKDGLIVQLADTLAVVYKSWDEITLRGNMSMVKVAWSTVPDLNRMATEIPMVFSGSQERFLSEVVKDALEIATTAATRRVT